MSNSKLVKETSTSVHVVKHGEFEKSVCDIVGAKYEEGETAVDVQRSPVATTITVTQTREAKAPEVKTAASGTQPGDVLAAAKTEAAKGGPKGG